MTMNINAERDHGLIVWGRMSSKTEPWAGIVISAKKLELLFEEKENYTWVFWVHQNTFSHLKNFLIFNFVQNLECYSKNIKPPRKNNVIEAIKLLFQQYGFKAPTNIFKQNTLIPKVKTDILKMTFNIVGKSNRNQSWFISASIINFMKNVNNKNIHQTVKKNIKLVQKHTSGRSKFCIACRSSAKEMKHPIFCGSLCDDCFSKEKAIDSLLSVATDGSNSTCAICLRTLKELSVGLKLVLCNFCVRSYCSECLGLYCGDYYLNIILKAPSWKCIACNPSPTTCALRKRIVKEQLNNIYSLFPAIEKLSIEHTKVKAREICVLTSEDIMVSQILEPYKFPFKFLPYKDIATDTFKTYKNEFDKFKLELKQLDHQHVVKLLLRCYSNPKEYSNKKNKFGTMEAFFNFYKLKCTIGNFGQCYFWAFESSSSITVEEQYTITRFCGKRPILIGTNTPDVRQRGRFIWTNISVLASNVQALRKYNIFLADIKSDERNLDADEDEKPVLYNSLCTILNALLKNNLELEV